MTNEELQALLFDEAKSLLTEKEVYGERFGYSGQWDDAFDHGVAHGRAELATELLQAFHSLFQ